MLPLLLLLLRQLQQLALGSVGRLFSRVHVALRGVWRSQLQVRRSVLDMNRAYAPEHASALNEHNCICWTMRKRGGFFVQNGGMDAFLIMDAFLSGAPFAHYHPENSTGAETPEIRPFSPYDLRHRATQAES